MASAQIIRDWIDRQIINQLDVFRYNPPSHNDVFAKSLTFRSSQFLTIISASSQATSYSAGPISPISTAREDSFKNELCSLFDVADSMGSGRRRLIQTAISSWDSTDSKDS